MTILDFLTTLPAEEKDIFLNMLEETGSPDIAMKEMMLVLAESEPKLARQLEGSVSEPIRNKNKSGFANRWAKRVQTFLGLDCYSL